MIYTPHALFDNGHCQRFHDDGHIAQWRAARERALAAGDMVVPRRIVAVYRPKPSPQARGGKARAEKLTPKRRREIAKKAADARWSR